MTHINYFSYHLSSKYLDDNLKENI